MADGSTRKDATGTTETIASDDIANVKWPRTKIAFGGDGSATEIDGSNPLPTNQRKGASGVSSAVNVATTSTTVLAANSNRLSLVIINDSDVVVWLKLGSGATVHSGIRLNPNGGSWQDDSYTGIVTGIHEGTGSKVVCVNEVSP